MMKQLQQMQERMLKVQGELGEKNVTGTAGGGMGTVTVNGHQKALSVAIKPEVVAPADVEMLQDLVLAAPNDALGHGRQLAQQGSGAGTGRPGPPPRPGGWRP